MKNEFSRRQWLAGAAGVGIAVEGFSRCETKAAGKDARREPFGYCLNTSTIRGQHLSIVEVVDVASRAGYTGLEPWLDEIERYVKSGGSLSDLRKRIADRGLTVESSIAFCEWLVDDEAKRKAGVEALKRSMEVVRQIGGKRIAAPPAGATKQADLSLARATERYRAILEIGDQTGVVPELELWGFSKTLSRLSEVVHVALESDHPKACVLPDVYHLYKGGSGFNGLRLLSGSALHVIHLNDFPAKPPRAQISDAQRVYPGDGVAPLAAVLRDLRGNGFRGMLSLELFNQLYWKQDALTVAKTGLQKMQELVQKSVE
jgi:2-keto-myo-inositol isomerase